MNSKFGKFGKFVVVEGIDCSGKSTLLSHIDNYYSQDDRVLTTRALGATSISPIIRSLIVSGSSYPRSTFFLAMSDLCQTMQEVIEPAYRQGKIIVCDRWWPTTFSYQMADDAFANNHWALDLLNNAIGIRPDYLVYLDRDLTLCLEDMRAKSADHFELKPPEFFGRVIDNYEFVKKSLYSQGTHVITLDSDLNDNFIFTRDLINSLLM